MKNPTYQELMQYVDGTLETERRHEMERVIARSSSLRKEIEILEAMKTAVMEDRVVAPRRFTEMVMSDIVPQRHEAWWYRIVRNSSNVFALIIVLTMIIFTLTQTSGGDHLSQSVYTRQWESLSPSYTQFAREFTGSMNRVLNPIGEASGTTAGKLVALGATIFFFYVFIDGVLQRRLRIRK